MLFTYFIIILQNDLLTKVQHNFTNNLVLIIYYYLKTKKGTKLQSINNQGTASNNINEFGMKRSMA